MSMPALQRIGTAKRQQIFIRTTEASAAGAVLPSPTDVHQAFVKRLRDNVGGVLCMCLAFRFPA